MSVTLNDNQADRPPGTRPIRSPIRVGFTFNLKSDWPGPTGAVEDLTAEFDSEETVLRIAGALSAAFGGRVKVLLLPHRHDLLRQLPRSRPDLIFNLAEGWQGRNRELLIPALLELLGVPYTGSDPLTLGLTMDKALAKRMVASAGVPTAPHRCVKGLEELRGLLPEELGGFPLFVKPNCEGSSKGVRSRSRVTSPEELEQRVRWVLDTYRQPALVERFLSGREFSVGVLGNGDRLQVLPVLEVRPALPSAEEAAFVYCYETKSGNREVFLCPAPIDPQLQRTLEELARAAFRALDCRDVARIDFRLDEAGVPHFLEVNPLPGMSPVSLLTFMGQAAGMDLVALVSAILEAAFGRWEQEGLLERNPRLALARDLLVAGRQAAPATGVAAAGIAAGPAGQAVV